MLRRSLISIGALGVFTVLAFGSGGSDLSAVGVTDRAANKTACESYVAHWNDLECLTSDINAATMCDGQEKVPADMASYWSCMEAAAKCTGGDPDLPDLTAQQDCDRPR